MSRRPDPEQTPAAAAPHRAGRGAASMLSRVLIVLLGIALGWSAVSVQLSARAAQAGQYAAARMLNPASTLAAGRLGDLALDAGRADEAIADAAQAAVAAPYTANAVRTLGLVATGKGDTAGGNFWMGLAAALGWRDLPTQLWIADRLLAAHSYGEAWPRIDALLRQLPGRERHPVLQLVNAFMGLPAARAGLIERLEAMPTWRADFMNDVTALAPGDYPGRERLVRDMRSSAAPIGRGELQPYVAQLVATGEYAHGYAFWRSAVADPRWSGRGYVYDGGFDAASDGEPFPFEWSIPEDAAGMVGIGAGAAGDNALQIDATGDLPATLVAQDLVLPAGSYELGARVAGTGAEQVHWELRCADGPAVPLERQGDASVGGVLRFVIPPSACPMQRLELRSGQLASAGQVDLRIDDVAVRRTSGA